MGSKKNKKIKQEETETRELVETEKPKRSSKRKLVPETELEPVIGLDVSEDLDTSTKHKKKKKKIKIIEDIQLSSENDFKEVVKNGFVKDELKEEEEEPFELPIAEEIKLEESILETKEDSPVQKQTLMPQNDLLELCRRIELLLPQNDSMSYRSRLEKLDWNHIVFSHYSVDECKQAWINLQKKIRRYRILGEVLGDAKNFILNPPKGKRKHAGMPQKPQSSYQIFYKKKIPVLQAKSPSIDIGELSRQISQMFKNLSPEKRAKYDKLAAQARAKYHEELETFYTNHPEIERPLQKLKEKKKNNKPKKPRSPFLLYFEHFLRKNGEFDVNDVQKKNALKERCKEQWKHLAVKKKVLWITKAEQDIARYEEEVKEYSITNPNFVPVSVKHIISKEELALKDRLEGKPDKPPNSAYSLFSRLMLQSEEIKKINAKNRMNFIANQWKTCSEADKNNYKIQSNQLVEQYKKDYLKYLESLPEDKRQLEIQKNAPKKRPKSENSDDFAKKKPKKGSTTVKITEPTPPPISAFRYFANANNYDDKNARKAWKKLTEDERNGYEKKLVEIKREYILEFEKFLNSLSKEELETYSKTKQELPYSSKDFVGDSSSSSGSEQEDQSDDDDDDSDE